MGAIEPKPVEKIELNEKNVKLRAAIFFISLIVLIVSAIFIVVGLTKKESGWNQVTASPSIDINCDDDFYLSYRLGTNNSNVNAELKQLSVLYTEYLENSYVLLNEYKEYDNYTNLCTINNKINEEIEIDSFLYQSLTKILENNNRLLYSGILLDYYNLIIFADSYDTAYNLNPFYKEEKKDFVKQISNFINDDNSIKLELLGNNKVKLNVSYEYKTFCEENEFNTYLSFSYLKNAFIIDYVADKLIENNFIYGNLSTYDGYFRNLNTNGNLLYSLDILDYNGNSPAVLASFISNKALSAVQFRDFKYYVADLSRSYEFKGGKTINYYIDLSTGLPLASKTALTAYDYSSNCVDVALGLSKLFINSSFENDNSLKLIYVDGYNIYYNENGIEFSDILSYGDISYKVVYKNDWKK